MKKYYCMQTKIHVVKLKNLIYLCTMTPQQIGQRRNLLRRYKLVLEEFNKHDATLIPITTIHRRFIYPKFAISRDTLYNIFNTDIDSELERLKQIEIQAPGLFD